MQAAYHTRWGGIDTVQIGTIPRPIPTAGQVLVRVDASSLNPADWKVRSGTQKALLTFQFPRAFGFDFAGTVCELGAGAGQEFPVGARVFGMVKGVRTGGTAEYLAVDENACAAIPEAMKAEEAAAIPLVGLTAVLAFRKCGLQERTPDEAGGPRVLITGGAGGVGTHAIQIARGLFGASYVATTASPGVKTELVRGLGADKVVDYRARKGKWWEELMSDPGFDAIFDCTGEAKSLPVLLAQGGGMVSILAGPTARCLTEWVQSSETTGITCGVKGFLSNGCGGAVVDLFSGARGLRRACAAKGGTFEHAIGTGSGEDMKKLAKLIQDGRLRAVIDKVYPLAQCRDAFTHLESGRAAGKIIIEVKGSSEAVAKEGGEASEKTRLLA